jgi:hypothetical protein
MPIFRRHRRGLSRRVGGERRHTPSQCERGEQWRPWRWPTVLQRPVQRATGEADGLSVAEPEPPLCSRDPLNLQARLTGEQGCWPAVPAGWSGLSNPVPARRPNTVSQCGCMVQMDGLDSPISRCVLWHVSSVRVHGRVRREVISSSAQLWLHCFAGINGFPSYTSTPCRVPSPSLLAEVCSRILRVGPLFESRWFVEWKLGATAASLRSCKSVVHEVRLTDQDGLRVFSALLRGPREVPSLPYISIHARTCRCVSSLL